MRYAMVGPTHVQQLNWYRNADSNVFHRESYDWVRTGRALCSADISRPGFTINDRNGNQVIEQPTDPRKRFCKHCVRISVERGLDA